MTVGRFSAVSLPPDGGCSDEQEKERKNCSEKEKMFFPECEPRRLVGDPV